MISLPDSNWQTLLNCGPAALAMVTMDALDKKNPAPYLTPEEQHGLASFCYERRRLEWLGGRLAAKQAAGRLAADRRGTDAGIEWHGWAVAAGDDGRPFLARVPINSTGLVADISITHSSGLAAGMAVSKGRCGIDLQRISTKTIKVRERFCGGAEEEILEAAFTGTKTAARLTILWAAKEALRKAAAIKPLPGFLAFHLNTVTSTGRNNWQRFDFGDAQSKKYRVAVTFYNDFALAVTHRKDRRCTWR